MIIIILLTCVSLYSLSLPENHGQFSNKFPGGRQKVKLINIPAGKKTIQRHFASPWSPQLEQKHY